MSKRKKEDEEPADGFVGRAPDWDVTCMDKITNRKGKVGVAWSNPDGSISIKLNFNVVLDMTRQDLSIRLWPATTRPATKTSPAES